MCQICLEPSSKGQDALAMPTSTFHQYSWALEPYHVNLPYAWQAPRIRLPCEARLQSWEGWSVAQTSSKDVQGRNWWHGLRICFTQEPQRNFQVSENIQSTVNCMDCMVIHCHLCVSSCSVCIDVLFSLGLEGLSKISKAQVGHKWHAKIIPSKWMDFLGGWHHMIRKKHLKRTIEKTRKVYLLFSQGFVFSKMPSN